MASHKPSHRLGGSVFAKLVAIMLAMAACLLLMVAGFFWLIVSPNFSFSVDRLAREYAAAIAVTAPDHQTAIEIRNRLDVPIRYEGPGGNWATDNDLPSITEVRAGSVHRSPHGRDYYLVPGPNGGTYLFAWNLIQPMRTVHVRLLLLLLFLMAAVLVSAYAVLKILLRPVRWLGEGVEQLGSGQLDIVLPVRTRDEFGALTDAFNRMVRRVREMIHTRDQLLLDVSHELRSPLTRMKIALELLPESESKEELVTDIGEMETMIAELLELERLRNGRGLNPSLQDLAPILREMAARFNKRRPGARLIAPSQKIELNIDEDKVRTVLRNLLENAFKYSLPDCRPVEISCAQNQDSVIVRVCDDGPGIPTEDAANLFEPFFRVDRSRSKKTGGYGLGLSICKRIMEAHGGDISFESNLIRGTSFILTFPRAASKAGTNLSEPSVHSRIPPVLLPGTHD
jgi:signal transduction histidine kinase